VLLLNEQYSVRKLLGTSSVLRSNCSWNSFITLHKSREFLLYWQYSPLNHVLRRIISHSIFLEINFGSVMSYLSHILITCFPRIWGFEMILFMTWTEVAQTVKCLWGKWRKLDFRYGQKLFPLSPPSRPALRPSQPAIQMILENRNLKDRKWQQYIENYIIRTIMIC